MPLTFAERLQRAQSGPRTAWCASAWIRTRPRCRADLRARSHSRFLAFGRRIVDATRGIAAAYKPQIAFYSALGKRRRTRRRPSATSASARRDALVILDAKRGDIGNTAEAYAREAFDRYGADAVTVNPYMGEDSVRAVPRAARPRRGRAVPHIESRRARFPGPARSTACRCTGGSRRAPRARWNAQRNLMLVVGATYPARNGGTAPARIRSSGSWCRASARKAAISSARSRPASMRRARGS